MIVGAQTNAAFTFEDLELLKLGGFDGVKLYATDGTRHTVEDAALLRAAGAKRLCVRLPDTVHEDGRYPSSEEYAHRCKDIINEFYYRAGVKTFQVDNEPNLLWLTFNYGPWQYQYFMRRAIPLLRSLVPLDVRLISPPLSFAPGLWSLGFPNPGMWILDDWLAAFGWTDGGRMPAMYRLFDAVGAHPYFQSERQLYDPSYGGCFQTMRYRSGGMPVVCLEWGCSIHQAVMSDGARYTDEGVEIARARLYPQWLRWVESEHPYVEGSYLFILPGATPDWAGFFLTERGARAIARRWVSRGGAGRFGPIAI